MASASSSRVSASSLPELVEQVAVGVVLVVEDIVPHPGERIGQRTVDPLHGPVAVVDLAGLALGSGRSIGLGQLGGRLVVGEIAVHEIDGPKLQLLGAEQGRIVGLGKLLAETGVVDRVAHLERIGDTGGRAAGRGGVRIVQIGQHPLLLDRVDAVDQPALGVPEIEDPALQPQDLLGAGLAFVRILAQALTHLFDGTDHRIHPRLQDGVLAQQGHVLPVAFQPGNAGLNRRLLRRKRQGGKRQPQNRKKKNMNSAKYHFRHLHHLMKNS